MRTLTADFFVSLDGFAAAAGRGQEWIGPYAGADMGKRVKEVLSEPQVILLGRKTYEILFGFWPASKAPQAGPMNDLPKLVFSRTLKGPLGWNNAELAPGEAAETLRALKQEAGPPLRTIGSGTLVRSLVELGLVDRLRLLVFPVVLGNTGSEPIFAGYPPLGLELIHQETLDGSTLLLEYRPTRPQEGSPTR